MALLKLFVKIDYKIIHTLTGSALLFMKVQFLSCLAALALLFSFNACNQSPLIEEEQQIDGISKAEGPASLRAQLSNDVITIYDVSVDLIAGQNKVAGKVNVGYDDENLYVTYATENGWVLN